MNWTNKVSAVTLLNACGFGVFGMRNEDLWLIRVVWYLSLWPLNIIPYNNLLLWTNYFFFFFFFFLSFPGKTPKFPNKPPKLRKAWQFYSNRTEFCRFTLITCHHLDIQYYQPSRYGKNDTTHTHTRHIMTQSSSSSSSSSSSYVFNIPSYLVTNFSSDTYGDTIRSKRTTETTCLLKTLQVMITSTQPSLHSHP